MLSNVLSLLNTVSIAVLPIWGPARTLRALRFDLLPETDQPVDVAMLLRTIEDACREPSPILILSSQDPHLILSLLQHPPMKRVWLEVPSPMLADELLLVAARQAKVKGWPLVWPGDASGEPPQALRDLYHRQLLDLAPALLRLKRLNPEQADVIPSLTYRKDQIYRGVDSFELMKHCLDIEKCWGLAGWPVREIARKYRTQAGTPQRLIVSNMIGAMNKDASIDRLELYLTQDPALSYRFLRFVNSVAVGCHSSIDSIRRGLTMVGTSKLRTWLDEQVVSSTSERNLTPIRLTSVLRALLTETLMEVGIDQDLQKELYLCGLYSQLDVSQNEQMSVLLQHVPLPERLVNALGGHHGLYWPALDITLAIETGQADEVSRRSIKHRFALPQINRTILRLLTVIPNMVQIDTGV